ncbi:hypothetical protein NDU88_001241 [Pleurodeles waltl]|uniref:Uncharacterized protein n=1 Tax=Pleurodeles waltl TaxID=8319 RepID=A0AAV7KPR9_PLEWA|nr:hypothetical protein NDU88_001241 [Pleurodeles waltl]
MAGPSGAVLDRKGPVERCLRRRGPAERCLRRRGPAERCLTGRALETAGPCSAVLFCTAGPCSAVLVFMAGPCSAVLFCTGGPVQRCSSARRGPVQRCLSSWRGPVQRCPSARRGPVQRCSSARRGPVQRCSSSQCRESDLALTTCSLALRTCSVRPLRRRSPGPFGVVPCRRDGACGALLLRAPAGWPLCPPALPLLRWGSRALPPLAVVAGEVAGVTSLGAAVSVRSRQPFTFRVLLPGGGLAVPLLLSEVSLPPKGGLHNPCTTCTLAAGLVVAEVPLGLFPDGGGGSGEGKRLTLER